MIKKIKHFTTPKKKKNWKMRKHQRIRLRKRNKTGRRKGETKIKLKQSSQNACAILEAK